MIARAIRRPALSRATTFARSFAPAARLVHTEKKIEESAIREREKMNLLQARGNYVASSNEDRANKRASRHAGTFHVLRSEVRDT